MSFPTRYKKPDIEELHKLSAESKQKLVALDKQQRAFKQQVLKQKRHQKKSRFWLPFGLGALFAWFIGKD